MASASRFHHRWLSAGAGCTSAVCSLPIDEEVARAVESASTVRSTRPPGDAPVGTAQGLMRTRQVEERRPTDRACSAPCCAVLAQQFVARRCARVTATVRGTPHATRAACRGMIYAC